MNDYDETRVDFGTGSKLLRDAVYCKGSASVLGACKKQSERVCIVNK